MKPSKQRRDLTSFHIHFSLSTVLQKTRTTVRIHLIRDPVHLRSIHDLGLTFPHLWKNQSMSRRAPWSFPNLSHHRGSSPSTLVHLLVHITTMIRSLRRDIDRPTTSLDMRIMVKIASTWGTFMRVSDRSLSKSTLKTTTTGKIARLIFSEGAEWSLALLDSSLEQFSF